MPRRSPSNRTIAVIGRGAGLGAILRTLREIEAEVDVIVAVAEGPAPTAAAEDALPREAALEELRRSFQAMADDHDALARALRRPLSIDRLGRHTLGNLMLRSLSSAFGDLTAASEWLGEQLGLDGAVLPATPEALQCRVVPGANGPRLRFVPRDPPVSEHVLDAIRRADWILLAPGAVESTVLPAAAVPAIAAELARARGQVVWICTDTRETVPCPGAQLDLLCRHGVRVDTILYDSRDERRLDHGRLRALGITHISRPLVDPTTGRPAQDLLRGALEDLTRPLGQHA